jgi:hypothetical protein
MSGGIVGYNCTTITKCLNAGRISATNSAKSTSAYAGGIVGYNIANSIIHTCENGVTARVNASYYYGGIAGDNKGTIFSCCTNNGTPTRWISSGTDAEPMKNVTTTEHTDN